MRPTVVESTPTFIRGKGLSAERMFRLNRDPLLHMAVDYDRERQQDEDTGVRINGPQPDGMSGGPVWLILPNGMPVLMAIGTFHDPVNRVLIGTFLQPVIRLLKQTLDLTSRSGDARRDTLITIPDRLIGALGGIKIRVQMSASTHGPAMMATGDLVFENRERDRAVATVRFPTGAQRTLTQPEIDSLEWAQPNPESSVSAKPETGRLLNNPGSKTTPR
ncbi:hypothetical protein [Opitutus sp. ER46]|uniref:hypothetical protein n=1 Tax=Opitutus sp. ER46 TaxID=2161864 RepID=UPI000D31CE93|nr:hypothetical protein [Opitutus sp. ER46]PTX90957.1 hypothetical protein DB354_20110 [Opitutus sp. ER46]